MGMLEGKIILITGTTSGMGRAAMQVMAREGAHVIGTARRADRGEAIAQAIRDSGGMADFFQCDIADPPQIDVLFAKIEEKFGRLDGALNNAASNHATVAMPDVPVETYDQVFNTNVRGTWLCLRHELRIMREQKKGAVVITSSTAGIRAFPGLCLYTASKHALIGMAKSAAQDAAKYGVRVNVLAPGTTRTEMMEELMKTRPGGEAATLATIPLGRAAAPEEQAEAAAWLLSDRASFVTGDVLVCDGGFTK